MTLSLALVASMTLIGLSLAGCGGEPPVANSAPPPASGEGSPVGKGKAELADTPAAEPDSEAAREDVSLPPTGSHLGANGRPWARIGLTALSEADFDAYLAHKRLRGLPLEQRNQVMDRYLERFALSQAIQASAPPVRDAVEAEIEELIRQVWISRYFEAFLEQALTAEAVANYYRTHLDAYRIRRVHVAHILVPLAGSRSQPERQAARTAIQAAYSELQTGTPFAAVAARFSRDAGTASDGGRLGWINEGTVPSAFFETAWGLEPGTHSHPVETPVGFHIIRSLEPSVIETRPLQEVAGEIRHLLRTRARAAETERLLSQVTIHRPVAALTPGPGISPADAASGAADAGGGVTTGAAEAATPAAGRNPG